MGHFSSKKWVNIQSKTTFYSVDTKETNEYLKKLEEYSILDYQKHDVFSNEKLLYSQRKYEESNFNETYVLASSEDILKGDDFHTLDSMIDASIEFVSINALYNNYYRQVKELRSKGFHNLKYTDDRILKRFDNIESLKRLNAKLKRLHKEIERSESWFKHNLKPMHTMENHYTTCKKKLNEYMFTNLVERIKYLQEVANFMDTTLTDFLSAKSTFVMYRLQKSIWTLTIVVTIAAIISLMK